MLQRKRSTNREQRRWRLEDVLKPLALILLPLIFLTLQVARGYPLVDDVNPVNSAGHDWLSYKQYAQSILRDGLALSAIPGEYRLPGGPLYSYFVAFVFAVFGENTAYVYLVQAVTLGLSVATMYVAIVRYTSMASSTLFLVVASILAYLDVFRWYSKTLLTENLLLPILSAFFFLIFRGEEKRRFSLAFAAGLVFGFAILTRPNVVLIAPVTALLLLIWLRGGVKHRLLLPTVFAIGCLLPQLLLVWRNVAVTGKITAGSFTPLLSEPRFWGPGTPDPETLTPYRVTYKPRGSFGYYWDRTLFCFGVSRLGLVKRWIAIWSGVVAFLVLAVGRRRLQFWEATLLAFIATYLVPLISGGVISAYGYRMVLPVVPAALALAIRSLDLVRSLSTSRAQ